MPYCAWCGSQVAQVSHAPCPSCGNPSNGAPKPVVKGGTKAPIIIIAVVVGALFIVAIIGILAAIAIPNLLTAMQRSKQKRTMADIRSMATAIHGYSTDTNAYPQPEEMEQSLVPTYIKVLPKLDGWAKPLRYECWSEVEGAPCDQYLIASGGRDGAFEQPASGEYEEGATTNFDADIVFSNGKFVRYPQGVKVD